MVFSVALLNVANYAHWISFASVNSMAAAFYQVSVPASQCSVYFKMNLKFGNMLI